MVRLEILFDGWNFRCQSIFFSDEDLIRILNFLARFMREADVQSISEAQAFIPLLSYLTGFVQGQFEAGVEMTNWKEGKMWYRPEVV